MTEYRILVTRARDASGNEMFDSAGKSQHVVVVLVVNGEEEHEVAGCVIGNQGCEIHLKDGLADFSHPDELRELSANSRLLGGIAEIAPGSEQVPTCDLSEEELNRAKALLAQAWKVHITTPKEQHSTVRVPLTKDEIGLITRYLYPREPDVVLTQLYGLDIMRVER